MAEQHLSAPPRARSGRSHRSSFGNGVGLVAARHPEQFTVVGNHLAQHPEMSLTAIGLATHIQSLPEGTPVGIKALAAKFPEGETRIAAALRELEAYGYLARTRERMPSGQIVTRTVSYNQPRLNPAFTGTPAPVAPRLEPAPEPEEPEPAAPTSSLSPTAKALTAATSAAAAPAPSTPGSSERTAPVGHLPLLPASAPPDRAADPPHQSAATALLARLRVDDPRLLLSERDIHRLAPAVNAWLERGVDSAGVRRTLSASLPVEPLRHPAAFLAHRLTALLPPPLPAATPRPNGLPELPRPSRPAPFQTCDGCERAFRSAEPGHCRDCAPHFAAVA